MSTREHSPVFRESFLAYQFEDERYETMRRFGEILDELACEANTLAPSFPGPILYPELEAVAVDLSAVVEDLEVASRDADSEVPAQVKLAGAALGWAEQLRVFVSEIRRAVSPLTEDQQGTPSVPSLIAELAPLLAVAVKLKEGRASDDPVRRVAGLLNEAVRILEGAS